MSYVFTLTWKLYSDFIICVLPRIVCRVIFVSPIFLSCVSLFGCVGVGVCVLWVLFGFIRVGVMVLDIYMFVSTLIHG